MSWSTSELAAMAGTTANTIRHYHRLGLLDQPQRRYNGYKQYGVHELVQLLRIRRLAELGVPLSEIGKADESTESMSETLRALDAELAAKIDQLQKSRAEIAAVLRDGAPADSPAGFSSVASHLSEADSSLVHVYTQLYDESALADLRRMVEADAEADAVGDEIKALPADADEASRQRLAEVLAPVLARNLLEYAWLSDPAGHLSKSERVTQQTFIEAIVELYNPAQIDVLARAGTLANDMVAARRAAGGSPE
ncbi:MAG: MerR family transcriptional regulator [Microbacterium sp.]